MYIPWCTSVIIDDIKGQELQFAFGDQASTSSHFAPKYVLLQNDVQAGRDYRENFTGAHDAVAKNVERGNAQAGGLSRPIFESLLERGLIDAEKVRVLGYSPDIPQYPWVMRGDLASALKNKLKTAFYELDPADKNDQAILKPFKGDGFAPVSDADYDVIRAIRKDVMPQ